jgi:hypothetical protein
MKKYIVVKEFADKNNLRKHYAPGEELPGTFDEARLANIVKLGLAREEDAEAGTPGKNTESGGGGEGPVTDIDLSEKVADILPKIKAFADVEKLKQYLEAEKAANEPRKKIVEAIEARLANIVKGVAL